MAEQATNAAKNGGETRSSANAMSQRMATKEANAGMPPSTSCWTYQLSGM